MNRPATGVTTRRPEEPYVNSTSTVLWEVPGATRAPTRCGGRREARPSAQDPPAAAKRGAPRRSEARRPPPVDQLCRLLGEAVDLVELNRAPASLREHIEAEGEDVH